MLRCRIHIYYRDHIHAHWIQLQAHPNTKEFLTTSTHRSSQPHTSPKGMCCCQTVKSSFLSSFSLSVLSVTAWRLDFPRSWAASIHTPVKDLRQQSKLSMDTHTHAHTHTGNSVLFNCSSRDTDQFPEAGAILRPPWIAILQSMRSATSLQNELWNTYYK